MFNEICLNEEMLPKYTYVYIYIYIYIYINFLARLGKRRFMMEAVHVDCRHAND